MMKRGITASKNSWAPLLCGAVFLVLAAPHGGAWAEPDQLDEASAGRELTRIQTALDPLKEAARGWTLEGLRLESEVMGPGHYLDLCNRPRLDQAVSRMRELMDNMRSLKPHVEELCRDAHALQHQAPPKFFDRLAAGTPAFPTAGENLLEACSTSQQWIDGFLAHGELVLRRWEELFQRMCVKKEPVEWRAMPNSPIPMWEPLTGPFTGIHLTPRAAPTSGTSGATGPPVSQEPTPLPSSRPSERAVPRPTSGTPPASSDAASRPPAACCERCPGNDRDRFYVPLAPETDCQPGDARRNDLSVAAGTCANPLAEQPGPSVYGEACCAGKSPQTLYDSASSGDVNSEVGATLRPACGEDPCAASASGMRGEGPPSRLDVSILSTSPGSGGRNWVPEHPTLNIGKERLKPCAQQSFYAVKETGTKSLAVAAMATLGIEEDEARTAEASKGTACPSGVHVKRKRDTPQERAARVAAMNLLASQAKGQIEGLRATFDVTGREAQLRDARLEADVVNEVTQHKSRITVPMRFETPKQ